MMSGGLRPREWPEHAPAIEVHFCHAGVMVIRYHKITGQQGLKVHTTRENSHVHDFVPTHTLSPARARALRASGTQ
jgi:hypothetical protein